MPITLSNVQEVIERSIFEPIRGLLVEQNLLLDIELYNEDLDKDLYAADMKALKDNNPHGFVCDLISTSGYYFKGIKKLPRIVIDSQMFLPGELGMSTDKSYVLNGNTFDALRNPSISSDYFYNIHVETESIKQQRLLHALVSAALPNRGYIKPYTESTLLSDLNFFNERLGSVDHPDTNENIKEKIYRYCIKDVWESVAQVVATNIPKITDIDADPIIE